MFIYNRKYFSCFVILLAVELIIALYIRDKFIRPYFGDFLVVIMVYCFVRSFLKISIMPAAIGVFIFACFIEMLQYFNFIAWLGLSNSKGAKMLLGNSFEWIDILAYFLGTATVIAVEKRINKKPV